MTAATEALADHIPLAQAGAALDFPRGSLYRARQPRPEREKSPRPPSPPALSLVEKEAVHAVLNSERFQDSAPPQVHGTLLDKGAYLCSVRTMYRSLREHDAVHARRNRRPHPAYTKPELLATGPNQLWSWDITKLRGPVTWTCYSLYVILDGFSRYVVGWLIAERESAELAGQLIAQSCHADNGPAMIAKTVAQLLVDLSVAKSHSRPYPASDNPFSEAQFKTMKYRPDDPDRFGSIADARAWARTFFHWYNNEHRHSGLGLITPATVHYGLVEQLTAQRQAVLHVAYARHPERYDKSPP